MSLISSALKCSADTRSFEAALLFHWLKFGKVLLKCAKTVVDNGFSPVRRRAITEANIDLFLFGPLRANLGKILIAIESFPSNKCTQICHLQNIWYTFLF